MLVVYENQIVDFKNVDILRVVAVNDYYEVYILNREKFKYNELKIDKRFESKDSVFKEFNKFFINIVDDIYVNLHNIMFIDRVSVKDSLHKIDISVYLKHSTPFVVRTTTNIYDLFLRRIRERSY